MSIEVQNFTKQRTLLYQTDFFEVVSIEWSEGAYSPSHDHGWSQCSVLIEEGSFQDELDLGNKKESRRFEPGQVIHTPVGANHEIRCLSTYGKTLHVYTPRLASRELHERFHVLELSQMKKDLSLSHASSFTNLQILFRKIRDHSVSTESPYFMNQLFSGVSPQMLMAEELIAQTKTTLATHEASPVYSAIEAEIIEALGNQIGWSADFRDGVSVPGGSAANFMAMHCARQKRFPEMKTKGMRGQDLKVFVSSEAHYSFKKGASALGLGTDSIVSVPADANGKMDAQVLSSLINKAKNEGSIPLMVCATAGTTVKGSFDPVEALADICQQEEIWLHVDGAWGGPALFSKKLKPVMKGVERADSFAFDAHKLFGAGITCSFFLNRHPGLLHEANDVSGGDYLFHSDEIAIDRGRASWQCGRRADALSFWSIWKSLGTEGLGQWVDQMLFIRDEAIGWIKRQKGLELISDPEYLNICVRVKGNDAKKVREYLKLKNLAMVNYSADENGNFLRLILAHPKLQLEHIVQILSWALEVRV